MIFPNLCHICSSVRTYALSGMFFAYFAVIELHMCTYMHLQNAGGFFFGGSRRNDGYSLQQVPILNLSLHGRACTAMSRKRTSRTAEDRLLGNMDQLLAGKSYERLQELLQEGGEALVQKVINFIEYGVKKEVDEADRHKPFHKNVTKFGDLSLKELKVLFCSFHGPMWGEQLCGSVRLPACRSLLSYALKVELGDRLPRKCLADLADVCKTRYDQMGSLLWDIELQLDGSVDWSTQVGVFILNAAAGIITHRVSGISVQPAGIDFRAAEWRLENNHSEKSARLKNLTLGNTYCVVNLFRHARESLPRSVKVPFPGLEDSAPEGRARQPSSTSSLRQLAAAPAPTLPALQDGRASSASGRQEVATPTSAPRAAPESTRAASPAAAIHAAPANSRTSLRQESDGRFRLVRAVPAGSPQSNSLEARPSPHRVATANSSQAEALPDATPPRPSPDGTEEPALASTNSSGGPALPDPKRRRRLLRKTSSQEQNRPLPTARSLEAAFQAMDGCSPEAAAEEAGQGKFATVSARELQVAIEQSDQQQDQKHEADSQEVARADNQGAGQDKDREQSMEQVADQGVDNQEELHQEDARQGEEEAALHDQTVLNQEHPASLSEGELAEALAESADQEEDEDNQAENPDQDEE